MFCFSVNVTSYIFQPLQIWNITLPTPVFFSLFLLLLSLNCAAVEYRLPEGVTLNQQKVNLSLAPHEATFLGETSLNISIDQATDVISYHSRDLTIKSVELVNGDKKVRLPVVAPDEYDIVRHQLKKAISGPVTLNISYSGKINDNVQGLFVHGKNTGSPYIFSQFQEMEARSVFPAFDDPGQKAVFEFTVKIPADLDALHNSHPVSIAVSGSQKIIKFAKTARLYTDVLVLAVGKFRKVTLANTAYNSSFYSPEGQNVALPDDIDALINNSVSYMADYLKLPFPYDKLDFFVAPISTLAAMENVGLIALHSNQLPEAGSGKNDICHFRKLIAHEIVHMWFGNHITMQWYNDYWMNESFAEFFAAKIIQQHYPDTDRCIYTPQFSAFADDNVRSRPLRSLVRFRSDNEGIGELAYTKGRTVLEMLEQAVGAADFKKHMREYVKQVAGGNTASEIFSDYFSSYSFAPALLQSFTEQSGYPLVSLTRQDNRLYLQQQSFQQEKDKLWTIPLTIKEWDGHIVKHTPVVLQGKRLQLNSVNPDNSFFIDTSGAGYYLSYDKTGNAPFPVSLLSKPEKMSYMNNQEALATASYLDYMEYTDGLVHILNTLPHHSEEATKALSALQNAFIELLPQELIADYAEYLVAGLPKALQWDILLQQENGGQWVEFYGVYLQQDEAIKAAKKAYSTTKLTELKHRLAVLRVIVSIATMQQYTALLDMFATADSSVKDDLLNALGYVSTHEQLSAFYQFLLSDVTNEFVIDYRFQFPAFQPRHREFVAEFFRSNKARISNRIADDKLQWFPYNFLTACSLQEAELVKRTFSGWTTVPNLKEKLSTVIEKIQQCSKNSANSLASINRRLQSSK
ncbi:ERAP1-like C-terminal domain-containing protein [Rheinheimera sp. YQF-2]|uniref:Aminopeptidase N n=1 Tax=Rheinheimera lutimaris TaxID=2740584 RepID=A0A7Y5ANV6_9GAMM|nr:M1 family metallopeptidase [Rheinheimera lutimaris]NRQ41464.1 ERAP1-like C-terminal domain-containing protein [Rheinheimera lutimaris]